MRGGGDVVEGDLAGEGRALGREGQFERAVGELGEIERQRRLDPAGGGGTDLAAARNAADRGFDDKGVLGGVGREIERHRQPPAAGGEQDAGAADEAAGAAGDVDLGRERSARRRAGEEQFAAPDEGERRRAGLGPGRAIEIWLIEIGGESTLGERLEGRVERLPPQSGLAGAGDGDVGDVGCGLGDLGGGEVEPEMASESRGEVPRGGGVAAGFEDERARQCGKGRGCRAAPGDGAQRRGESEPLAVDEVKEPVPRVVADDDQRAVRLRERRLDPAAGMARRHHEVCGRARQRGAGDVVEEARRGPLGGAVGAAHQRHGQRLARRGERAGHADDKIEHRRRMPRPAAAGNPQRRLATALRVPGPSTTPCRPARNRRRTRLALPGDGAAAEAKQRDMTQVSNSVRPQPRRQGWLRRLRTLADRLSNFDFDELQGKIGKLEASLTGAEAAQRRITSLLLSEHHSVPFPRLVSLRELASADRFELESRCRALTKPVYLGDHTVLSRILGSYKLYLDTRDTGFGSHVMLDGYWEMWLTIFFARHLRPGMTVVDVGANFGYYTVLFGALVGNAGRVWAFEPNPQAVGNLRRSVELNGFRLRTTIVAAAAGAADGGEVRLFAPHGEPKNAAVVSPAAALGPELGTVHRVPQVTIDKAAAAARRIDFVKIDAEGAEEAVIAGMMQTLRRDRPPLILEFNAARYRDPGRFIDQLRQVYSSICYIDFDGNAAGVPLDQVVNDRSGDDWLLYLTGETADETERAAAGPATEVR
jgi:FkbM family methyltransferase